MIDPPVFIQESMLDFLDSEQEKVGVGNLMAPDGKKNLLKISIDFLNFN